MQIFMQKDRAPIALKNERVILHKQSYFLGVFNKSILQPSKDYPFS